MKCFLLTLAALGLALATGCGTPQYKFPETAPAGTAPAAGDTPVFVPPAGAQTNADQTLSDLLYPGNKITIIYAGVAGMDAQSRKHEEVIREDGYITPPYLTAPVKAAGKTIGKLQVELQKLYVPSIYKSATITVTREEVWFYVGGEVKNANRYIYSGAMTVLKAVQAAGDFTPFANRKNVKIIRANGKTITVNCVKALKNPKLDLPVYPGDQVIVPIRLL